MATGRAGASQLPKGVFTTRAGAGRDDLPEFRYRFPHSCLRQAEAAVGDWIVCSRPSRSTGRQAGVATARVTGIEPDPGRAGQYVAQLADFLDFESPVAMPAAVSGAAVRALTEADYERILRAGFASVLSAAAAPAVPDRYRPPGLGEEEQVPFERPIVERLTRRPFRDAAFAVTVKSAYDNTCAMTGIRIIDGGGRPEVQAAHIWPVAAGGPDSVRNGLALSATVHWMFDRGLVSVGDDFTILTAQAHLPPAVARLFNDDRRLLVPASPELCPGATYLRFHRETIFRG